MGTIRTFLALIVVFLVIAACASHSEFPESGSPCPVGGQLTTEDEARDAVNIEGDLKQGAHAVYQELHVGKRTLFCRFPVCGPTTTPEIYANHFRCVPMCRGGQVHNAAGDCVCLHGTTWQDDHCTCPPPRFVNSANECVLPTCPKNEVWNGSGCECQPPRQRLAPSGFCDYPPCPTFQARSTSGYCECVAPRVMTGQGSCVCPHQTHELADGRCEWDPCPRFEARASNGECSCVVPRVRAGDASCVCPHQMHELSDGACEWDPCPSFETRSNGTCVCASIRVRNGEGRCVCPAQSRETPGQDCEWEPCPAGMIRRVGRCVPNCDSEHVWDAALAVCVCPRGQSEDAGGNCVCAEGFTRVGGRCECYSPRERRDGECLCPPGKVADGAACVCPRGQEEDDEGHCRRRRRVGGGDGEGGLTRFCCDTWGNHRCVMPPALIGSGCFCLGQGQGVACP